MSTNQWWVYFFALHSIAQYCWELQIKYFKIKAEKRKGEGHFRGTSSSRVWVAIAGASLRGHDMTGYECLERLNSVMRRAVTFEWWCALWCDCEWLWWASDFGDVMVSERVLKCRPMVHRHSSVILSATNTVTFVWRMRSVTGALWRLQAKHKGKLVQLLDAYSYAVFIQISSRLLVSFKSRDCVSFSGKIMPPHYSSAARICQIQYR